MHKVCAVTGHRPTGFSWDYYDKQHPQHTAYLASMRQDIINLVCNEQCTTFITGGAKGVDLDFALTVLQLQGTLLSHIQLELAIPYRGHHNSMTTSENQDYHLLLQKANKVHYICQQYNKSCFMLRNRYMVDNAHLLIAYYNGTTSGGTYRTIQYAQRMHKPIHIVNI